MFVLIILAILVFFILIHLFTKKSKSSLEEMKTPNRYKDAYDLGTAYLNSLNLSQIPNPSVMFDIDDTLLNTKNNLKPIKWIIKLLNECQKRGILINIITARMDNGTQETIQDLENSKIPYNMLFLRKPTDTVETFKSEIKEHLYKNEGITTIMSVGDNYIDVLGSYSGYGLKLPNHTDPNLYQVINGKVIQIK